MRRITPDSSLQGIPCSIVAVTCAKGSMPDITDYIPKLKSDGWATLNVANKFIRENLDVKKRTDYKRGERPRLRDLHLDGRAVVCVYGHLVYVDHEYYHSFFINEFDDVVAVWELK